MRRMYTLDRQSLPNDYRLLNYIENTYESYINTFIKPTFNTEINIKFMITGNKKINDVVMGCENTTFFICSWNNNTSKNRYWIGWNMGILTPRQLNVETEVIFNDSQHKLYVDGVYQTTFTNSSYVGNEYMMICGDKSASKVDWFSLCRIYYVKIIDHSTETVLRDFVPALRISDSKPGLYDFVSQTFFTNQGSGEFIYG